MRRSTRGALVALLSAALLAVSVGSAARPSGAGAATYEVVDLGFLPGGYSSSGQAMNATGRVVGYATRSEGPVHAFRWANGVMEDLGSLPDRGSQAFGVNRLGHAVGVATFSSTDQRAVLWRDGAIEDLGSLGGGRNSATSINDAGEIAGVSANAAGQQRAVLWSGSGVLDLGTLGGTESVAMTITASGLVGGYARPPGDSTWHPCLWRSGAVAELGVPAGAAGSCGGTAGTPTWARSAPTRTCG